MSHTIKKVTIQLAVVIGLVVAAGELAPTYQLRLFTEILVFALFAASLNLLLGHTGLPSLGHALYFGVGAYTAAILVSRVTENFYVALALGALLSGLAAAFAGVLALRTSGVYFLMVTLAFGQLGMAMAINMSEVTGGADGISGVLRPVPLPGLDLYDSRQFYYFVAVVVAVFFVALVIVTMTPFGKALEGIRENAERMSALGYNVWAHRYAAFVIAGSVAGVAGVLNAYLNGFVSPEVLGLTTSAEALLMVVLGGPGTVFGPLVGAAGILGLEEATKSFLADHWRLLLGLAYVFTVFVARRGLTRSVPEWLRHSRRIARRGRVQPAAAAASPSHDVLGGGR